MAVALKVEGVATANPAQGAAIGENAVQRKRCSDRQVPTGAGIDLNIGTEGDCPTGSSEGRSALHLQRSTQSSRGECEFGIVRDDDGSGIDRADHRSTGTDRVSAGNVE